MDSIHDEEGYIYGIAGTGRIVHHVLSALHQPAAFSKTL